MIDRRFIDEFDDPAWKSTARAICDRHGFASRGLHRAASSDHVVFLLGDELVVKIYRPGRSCFERELRGLRIAAGKLPFAVPQVLAEGSFEDLDYAILTQVDGRSMTRTEWLAVPKSEQIPFVIDLALGLKLLHETETQRIPFTWDRYVEERASSFIERQIAHGVNARVGAALPKFLEENLQNVPRNCPSTFMHADVHFGNLRVARHGTLRISGLFDFADSICGFHEYEFLAVGVLMIQGQGELQREFFRAYGYSEGELDEEFRSRLMMLTMLYESADLRRYAIRLSSDAVNWPLDQLERGIWSFCR